MCLSALLANKMVAELLHPNVGYYLPVSRNFAITQTVFFIHSVVFIQELLSVLKPAYPPSAEATS